MKKDLQTKDKIIKMLMDKVEEADVRKSRSKLDDRPMIKDSNSPLKPLLQSNSRVKLAPVETPGSSSAVKPGSGWNFGRVDTVNKKYRLEDNSTRLSQVMQARPRNVQPKIPSPYKKILYKSQEENSDEQQFMSLPQMNNNDIRVSVSSNYKRQINPKTI